MLILKNTQQNNEVDDEDNSVNEETNRKGETNPIDDGEVFDTESGQIIYGGPFVGAIIFSLINLLFFVFAIILVWSYSQELQRGSYDNSHT